MLLISPFFSFLIFHTPLFIPLTPILPHQIVKPLLHMLSYRIILQIQLISLSPFHVLKPLSSYNSVLLCLLFDPTTWKSKNWSG